jgi:hypothetical protein
MTNTKNLGKRITNQNHTCAIHRNTTNSFIPLGSNIQFSTNTEKEQVITKKTCNNEQIELATCIEYSAIRVTSFVS